MYTQCHVHVYITMLHKCRLVKRVHLADEIHVQRVPESYNNSKEFMYRTRTAVSSAQSQELNSVERLEECFFESKAERNVRP